MSDKSVLERLQVKGERRLALVAAPDGMDAALGEEDRRAGVAEADVVLLFTPDRAAFDAEVPTLAAAVRTGAILWVAYPKLTSRLAADLSRDIIHRAAPEHGMDTVSQIAIDAEWSAMRLKRL